MLLDDRLFDQEWIQSMSNEDFRMLLYLMHFATKKCGIVELNMRMLNFVANTGHLYTKEEVLERFGNMLCMIPGKSNTAIFPNWIATNWAKNGKKIDTLRNPLFKSVIQELASYGMTIESLNAMAKTKITVKSTSPDETRKEIQHVACDNIPDSHGDRIPTGGKRPVADIDQSFEAFWKSYPGPRKVDKKKCRLKFERILSDSKSPDEELSSIMSGLEAWKRCSTWNKDGGAYIRAPIVWLNNENWKDIPDGFQDQSSASSELSERSSSIMDKLRKEGLA